MFEVGGDDSSLVCLLSVENMMWNHQSKWRAIKLTVWNIDAVIGNRFQIIKTWVMWIRHCF